MKIKKILILALTVMLAISMLVFNSGCKKEIIEETAAENEGTIVEEVETAAEKVTEIEKEAVVEEPVTLVVWHQFAGIEAGPWVDMKRVFEELYPNIKIEDTAYQISDMQPAITASFQSGEGADVIYYDASEAYLGAVVEAGYALDLSTIFVDRGWDQKMFKWAQEKSSYDGKNYGVGGYAEIVGLYYNATLFGEFGLQPPTTWDNMIAAAEKIKEEGLTPFAQGGLELWPASHYFGTLIHAIAPMETIAGAELLDGKGSWTDPAMIEAATECQKWVLDYGYFSEDVSSIAYQDASNDFNAGRGLMRIDGSWGIRDLGELEFEAHFVRFPEKNPNLSPQAEGGISSTWFVNKDIEEDKLEAALKFLDFIVFSEIANSEFIQDAQIPCVDFDVTNAGADTMLIEALQAMAEADTGEGLGYWIGYVSDPIFSSYMESGWQALAAGKITPEEFAEGAASVQEEARASR